jgi:WG containing repeat
VTPRFNEAEAFVDGVAIVSLDGKRGIIDATGAWVGETQLRNVDLNLDRGLLPLRSQDGKWGFVDAGGTIVIAPKFDKVFPFTRGISWVRSADKWCAIDRRGHLAAALPCRASAPTSTFLVHAWPY